MSETPSWVLSISQIWKKFATSPAAPSASFGLLSRNGLLFLFWMAGELYWCGRIFFAVCAVIKRTEKFMRVWDPRMGYCVRFLAHCCVGLAQHRSYVALSESIHASSWLRPWRGGLWKFCLTPILRFLLVPWMLRSDKHFEAEIPSSMFAGHQ